MPSNQSFLSSESRAFELLSNRIGVVYVNSDQIVESTQGIAQELSMDSETSIVSQPLTESFIELFGFEDTIDQILEGELPYLELQEVNRENEAGGIDYYDFSIYPADEDDASRGLVLLIENITNRGKLMQNTIQQRNELRLAQQELSKANLELHSLNELKSIFLSMAAHDLRSPLSVITTYSDIMMTHKGELDTAPFKPRYVFSRILEQSIWLNSLIDDILNLNMIEQGKFPVDLKKIDIQLPLTEVVNQFQQVFHDRNINLKLNVQDTPIWTMADENRIKQIAFNLIGNSAKFLRDKGDIEVSVVPDPDEDKVDILFADNGPGIPDEQQKRLFQLFYRTPGASKFSGTGLGLYIVKTITERHEGTISVFSKLNEGTTFKVSLPLLSPA